MVWPKTWYFVLDKLILYLLGNFIHIFSRIRACYEKGAFYTRTRMFMCICLFVYSPTSSMGFNVDK
jgi:hypothetical protein